MLGAAAASVELAVSGTSPLAVVLPAMLGTHIFIGIGEALITVGALALIKGARPDLLMLRDAGPDAGGLAGDDRVMIRRYWWVAGLVVAAAVVVILAPMASSDPDGLERVAIDGGFAAQGQEATFELLPDYSVPLLGDGPLSLIVAGLVGVAIIFGTMWLLGRALSHRLSPDRLTPVSRHGVRPLHPGT